MEDWRERARQHRFEEIKFLELPLLERAELLGWLRAIVPITSDEDGLERRQRHAKPSEISDKRIHAAARILALGELQASINGEPAEDSHYWKEEREQAEHYLQEVIGEEPVVGGEATPPSTAASAGSDVTGLRDELEMALRSISEDGVQQGPATPLSRPAHASACLEGFRQIDVLYSQMSVELDTDQERAWLREFAAGIAFLMFDAGRHFQAVWYKPYEVSALSGKKSLEGSKKGQAIQLGSMKKGTQETLDFLRVELERQSERGEERNMSRAAHKAERAGLGKHKSIMQLARRHNL